MGGDRKSACRKFQFVFLLKNIFLNTEDWTENFLTLKCGCKSKKFEASKISGVGQQVSVRKLSPNFFNPRCR